jgi:hypothetical protein
VNHRREAIGEEHGRKGHPLSLVLIETKCRTQHGHEDDSATDTKEAREQTTA